MYSKVEEYKNILKSDEQQYDAYIILEDGTKVDTDISGFKPIYNLGEKIIGNFTTKKIEFTLFNTSKYNITNKEIEAFVGLKINDKFNYISLGKFITDKPVIKDEAQDECTISATNYSLKFKVPYTPILAFPCTINKAIKDICEHLNIEYVENDFINKDYVLQEFFIEEDATFFDAIKILVEAGFANAIITNTNALFVKSPSMTVDYVLSLNELFDLKKEDNVFGPVNSIVASRIVADDGSTTEDVYKKDEDSINVNGLYEYKIIQNEAIDYDRQTAVNNMLAGILNFEYNPAKIEAVYNPAIEIGDVLEVPDKKTVTSFLLFVKEITADLSSGLMTIESTEKTQTETDYKSATAKDKRRNTEIKVNKMEGKIIQLVEETDENSQKLAQQQITIDGITQKVENVVETTKTVSGIRTITLENCVDGNLLELRIFGNNTNFDFLFPDEDLFPSDDLYPNHDEENMTAVYEIQVRNEDETSEVYRLAETYWLSRNDEAEDTFELKDGNARIIRRVNIYDGTTLEEEEIEELGEINIVLKEGTNIITTTPWVDLEVKYAIKNEYTDRFVTEVKMNSAIEQTESNINLSVNKTLESYSTTEEMEAAIDLKADQITSTVKTTINDLEIGGRNYLVGSNAYRRNTPVGFENVTGNDTFKIVPDMEAEVIPGETYILQVKSDGEVAPYHGYQHEDTRYKFTVWFYLFEENSTAIDFDMAVSCTGNTENTNPKYLGKVDNTYYWQYTIPAEMVKAKIRINTYADAENPQTVNFWDFKLEKGNKPTDWSPPSEDTDMAISQIKQTADNITIEVGKKVGKNEIKSQINQSAEGVKILANNIDFNGAISANGNFKIGTDGKMECTGAKINVEDDGTDKESASIIAESANRIAKLTSFGLFIEPKASGHMTEYVNVGFGDLASIDSNGYGFNFVMTNYATSGGMKENRAYWNVKDSAGDLLFADDTQFNLFSPGENTNLSLRNNGAFINGYQIQTNASDRRLKTNIQDSKENALDKIMQIQHRSFTWKENGQEQKNGYIAQELEQIDKEFVIVNDDKYSINLLNLLSTVTKAMQEQQEQIEQLKQEQQEKQEQIEQLKQELSTLKGVEK